MPSYSTLLGASVAFLASASQVAGYTAVTLNKQTWYGYPDNSESSSTAYDCSGRGYTAGGDGSFNNPLTYATASGSSLHSPCEVTWFPYLEKYLVMQDTCAGCEDLQIDVWIGNGNGGQSELNCENNSPSGNGHKLIRYGSSSHNANTNALWSKNGGCQVSNNVYPNGN